MRKGRRVKQTAPFTFRTVFRDTPEETTASHDNARNGPYRAVPGIVHDTTDFQIQDIKACPSLYLLQGAAACTGQSTRA